MFCPKCGVYLTENELLRSNVQYMNSVPVEYDARCPNCSMDIGSMRWGKFTVNPDLSEPRYEGENPGSRKESLIPPPPEIRPILRPMRSKRVLQEEAARLAEEERAAQAAAAAAAEEEQQGDGDDADKYGPEGNEMGAAVAADPALNHTCPHCGQPLPGWQPPAD